MRLRGIIAGGGARAARLAGAAIAAATLAAVSATPAARAAGPAVAPYGQVAAVGGLDNGRSVLFGPTQTTGITGDGDFVDPVGMAVSADPNVPGGEDIYVLDLVNPQAMNPLIAQSYNQDSLALEYRLQKIAITPSAANGSDTGSETVLACTTFTLQSTAKAPDQRAVSLAVDGPLNRVDVLVNAMPDDPNNQGAPGGYSIAEQVDQWQTNLGGGAPGACPPISATDLQTNAAVSSTTLVKSQVPGKGDIDGDSIAFAGTGTSAQLALGGSAYLNSPLTDGEANTQPMIELFGAGGTVVGKPWTGAEAAANSYAKAGPIAGGSGATGWGIDQSTMLANGSGLGLGDALYALSANPDGSLNVTLGPQEYLLASTAGYGTTSGADFEPIMATVKADLSTTSPILPSAQASPLYNYPSSWTADANTPPAGAVNSESAATIAAAQDTADGGYGTGSQLAPAGGTQDGGTLAPSVVELAGDGTTFPGGLYAGIVADDANSTANLDATGAALSTPPAWALPTSSLPAANVGLRIFTGCGSGAKCASGNPLGMIGNQSSGPCRVQAGDFGSGSLESMLALAAGPDGTVYALAQPDLDAADDSAITPDHPVTGSTVGDILFEFQPGAGSGGNPGTACPQPSAAFSVTDASAPDATADTGTGAVKVLAGAKIQLDASPSDLQGGVPWSYTWDSGGGTAGHQTASTAFAPDQNPDNTVYDRPDPTQTFTYTTPGQYTATLQLQSDFGVTTVSRPIDVVAPGPLTAGLRPVAGAVAGQVTTLSAAGTAVGAPDSIVDYHWDFGNGTSDETAGPVETWTFPSAGTYTVTLTAVDQLGRTQTATEQVSVAPPPPPPAPPAPPSTSTTTATPTPHTRARFSVSPKVRSVRRNAALSVKLSCSAGDRRCAGTIAVLSAGKIKVPGRKGMHVENLGKGTFSIAAGRSRTRLIRLAAVTRKLIAPGQDLKLSVIVVAHDAAGAHATVTVPVFLFPPRTSRPRKFG